MLTKWITHTVLKHTWQREGRAIQARFCCWTHQCKPRVTPLERKPGRGAAPDLWVCRIWGTDRGHAMGKLTQLRGECCGEQPPTTVTTVGGFIWVCNGYGDAVGNICTMWGCFLLFEVFSVYTYIVIPAGCGTGPCTRVTVSPLCFRQQTLLNSALQACGLNSFTPARTVPSPAIIFPPLFINKHPQRKFTGRKVS